MTFSVPLDALRALSASFLIESCSILRYTESNTADGTIQDWQTITSGVPCAISPGGEGGTEQLEGGAQLAAVNRWTVSLPALTDVTVRDRLVSGARTFEVQRVDARTFEARRDCICREVT